MKKHRRLCRMVLVALSLLLVGCGGTPLYELTAEEEALIVQYAAHFVSKYNIYQKDGLTVYIEKTEEDTSDGTEDSENSENLTPEVVKPENIIATGLKLPKGLKLSYVENTINDHVIEDGGYADANTGELSGFTFYIMHFRMSNDTDADIEVSNVLSEISFKLKSGSIVASSTPCGGLKSDLSTYHGTVPAGESVDVMLLFTIKESDGTKITDPIVELVTKK